MKRNIALLLVVVALALAGAWYGLAVDPAPTPRAEPAAEEGPIAVTNDTPDHEVIAPARPATPEPMPASEAAPAPAATPAHAEPAAPMTELESLEARWRELRRQGRWNEAAPLWEEIKQLRAAAEPEAPKAPDPQPFDETKGAWAPAEPWTPLPRKDMLPDPLPREPTKDDFEKLERPVRGWGSVSGRVVDHDGRGLSEVKLVLHRVSPTGVVNRLVPFEATTDDAGMFTSEDLPVGVWTVTARLHGFFQKQYITVRITAESATRLAEDVVLRKLSRLRMQLTCPTEPVADQPYTLRLFDEAGRQVGQASGIADGNGVVVFEDVADDASQFEVHGGKHQPSARHKCSLQPGQETDWGLLNLVAKK